MTNRKQKRKPEPSPKPEAPKVQHSPGGIKGRWLVNSLSFVLVILAVVVILISVGVSGYYYATCATTSRHARRPRRTHSANTSPILTISFTRRRRQPSTTFQDQDKFEQQFLDANGRILLSTSGLSGGGVASTEDASQALSGQKTAVFTGRDPLSGERVMSVTAPLLSARGDLVGGVRYITSLRIVERQIWMIVGFSLLACLLFLMLVVASNSYFIRSIVDPVLKINTIAKEIAAGRYGVRLQKTYDDEIGELCDTINYMSDEISRAERMKNDFISSVSHELRTPLTAIGGWSETLLAGGGEDPEEVMQGLTIIQKEAGRLTRMVEELLDFARIESGRMKLEIETFDMSIELYEAVYMYENLLKKSGIRLLYDEDVDANYYIDGDRHRMKQVYLNILDNAAKYGGNSKQIDIDLKRDGGNIVASVRDYGQGIPEAELPFVKEKFYEGSSKQRGSGIGLAVTEEIVFPCTAVRWISRPRSAREQRLPSPCHPPSPRRRLALPVPFRRHLKPRLPKESIHDNAKENHHRRSGDHRGYCNEGTQEVLHGRAQGNGELVGKTEPTPSRAPIWEKPILRGAYTLFTAMKEGMQAINYSTSFFKRSRKPMCRRPDLNSGWKKNWARRV